MVCTQFLGFRNFIHDGIVVLQQPPPLFHVVRFQNLLTGFLNGQFRGIQLPAVHHGKIAETYNIGGFNEWKNIDIIKVLINTVDRLLGRKEGEDLDLITYVTDRLGHDARYAIDSTKLQKELGWEPSLQFEEGIEKTVRWYLDNQEWMDNITSGEYQRFNNL